MAALPLLGGGGDPAAACRRRRRPSSTLSALCCVAIFFFFVLAQFKMVRGPMPSAAAPLYALAQRTTAPASLPPHPYPAPPESRVHAVPQLSAEATAADPTPPDVPSNDAAPTPVNDADPGRSDQHALPQPAATPAPTGLDPGSDALQQPEWPTLPAAPASPADDGISDAYFAPIDDAKKAAAEGRLHDWVWHLNLYLEQFSITPLHVWERPGLLFSRLTTKPLPQIDAGPLVTVIMVASNAEDTIEYAVNSILRQTWRRLELVIVDDASLDRTWSVLNDLSRRDARIKLVRNAVQVGPYISRNRVLHTATGAYITTQDADDWSLPCRLEVQVRDMVDSKGSVRANMMHMLRLQPSGLVSTAIASSFSPDGVARQAFVSAMYETRLLREHLGYWDSVRYGADGEMIRRAQKFLGPTGFHEIGEIGVFLADRPNSLGKQGYRISPDLHREPSRGWAGSSREAYRSAYDAWHARISREENKQLYLPFPLRARPFQAPLEMAIGIDQVCACLRGTEIACEG